MADAQPIGIDARLASIDGNVARLAEHVEEQNGRISNLEQAELERRLKEARERGREEAREAIRKRDWAFAGLVLGAVVMVGEIAFRLLTGM